MSNSLGALVVTLGLDASDYIKGMSKAEYEAQKSARALKKEFDDLATGLAALGIGAIFANMFNNAVLAADEAGKMAQSFGVSTEALSGLSYAAKLSDLSMEDLGKALKEVSVDAEDGGKNLARFGISARDSAGNLKTSEQLLLDYADVFSQLPDGVQKTALAVEVFGSKAGPGLIPFLNQGKAGIRELTDEAERFGLVISGEASKAAEEYSDNMDRLRGALDGLAIQISQSILPSLVEITEELLIGRKHADGWIDALVTMARIKPGDSIGDLRIELEKVEAAKKRYVDLGWNTDAQDASITRLQKQIAYTEELNKVRIGRASKKIEGEANGLTLDEPKGATPNISPKSQSATAKVDEAKKYLEQLEKQTIQARNLTKEEEALAEIQSGRLGKVNEQQKESILNAAKEIDNIKAKEKAEKDLAKATEEESKWLEKVKAGTEIGKVEEQAKEVERLNKAYEDGKLTYEVWQQALVNARKGTDESIELNRRLSAGLAQSFADGFADAILEAKSFSDVLSSVAVEIQRLIIKMMVIRPLQKSIEDGFNNSGGLSGIFSSIGSSFGGSNSGGYENLSFAGGGYTGSGSRSGGVDGMGGFPAILHPNETVVDHAMGQTLGGSNVQVNIINNSGSQVSQTRRDNADGSTTIDVMIQRIEEGIAGNVAAGTGALSGALGYRYGLQAT